VFHKVAENLYRLESSGGYYALVKKSGKQFRRSLKTKDRKLADRRLNELKEQVGVLTVSDDSKADFETVAKRWLESVQHTLAPGTVEQRQIRIKNIARSFKGTTIRNVVPFQCERWAVERAAEVAAETFVHELETLRAVFDYARKHGLVLTNPATDIKRPKIRRSKAVIPSREQFVKLVAQLRQSGGQAEDQRVSKEGADLVEFLAYSGARIGEARASKWGDVNFSNNMIWIHGTKSERSDRLIPMTDALREFLLRLKGESTPAATARIAKIDSAKKSLATACKKSGFPKFSHHDFRHFFATTCIESGVDVPTVSRWLGHSDGGALAMRVYGHLQVEHSLAMSRRVSFNQLPEAVQTSAEPSAKPNIVAPTNAGPRQVIAAAKAKYKYPWWASEDPLEVVWGQLHEEASLIPGNKLLEAARQAMGREVFQSELSDRQALLDELVARTPAATVNAIRARIHANGQGRNEIAGRSPDLSVFSNTSGGVPQETVEVMA
jgi:integrase